MTDLGEIDELRREPNPIRRAIRATELAAKHQEAMNLLASIRKEAVDEAHDALGMSYTEAADALGLTKGRITQIRQTRPPAPEQPTE